MIYLVSSTHKRKRHIQTADHGLATLQLSTKVTKAEKLVIEQ